MKRLTKLCWTLSFQTLSFQTLSFQTLGLCCAFVTAAVSVGAAQTAARPEPVEIPKDAITLEGIPTVVVEDTGQATTRHALTADEAAKNRLRVRVKDGRFFWESRDGGPMEVSKAGAYTYLSSQPGRYVRLTNLNGRITYVEHVDQESGSMTFRGELRIGLGK
jgi:hypothetical protein